MAQVIKNKSESGQIHKEAVRVERSQYQPIDPRDIMLNASMLLSNQFSASIAANETAIFTVPTLNNAFPHVALKCNDDHGHLIHYIKEYTGKAIKVLVQNLVDKPREITLYIV